MPPHTPTTSRRTRVAKKPAAPRRRPAPLAADDARERLAAQELRVARARKAAAIERERLEELVADCVSSQPYELAWYDHPGILTREQAIAWARLRDAAGLHRLMDRVRSRRAKRSS